MVLASSMHVSNESENLMGEGEFTNWNHAFVVIVEVFFDYFDESSNRSAVLIGRDTLLA